MRRFALIFAAALWLPDLPQATEPDPGTATAVVAARAIRARTVIGSGDIVRSDEPVPGALSDPEDVIGQEALGWLQSGKPIMPEDVGPPALVERNQVVTMRFRKGMLEITAEGRALERAPLGARIRVMNLDSRTTVNGTVVAPGVVEVH
jgi:flagella basal body P-ring formation protein FlgA